MIIKQVTGPADIDPNSYVNGTSHVKGSGSKILLQHLSGKKMITRGMEGALFMMPMEKLVVISWNIGSGQRVEYIIQD